MSKKISNKRFDKLNKKTQSNIIDRNNEYDNLINYSKAYNEQFRKNMRTERKDKQRDRKTKENLARIDMQKANARANTVKAVGTAIAQNMAAASPSVATSVVSKNISSYASLIDPDSNSSQKSGNPKSNQKDDSDQTNSSLGER